MKKSFFIILTFYLGLLSAQPVVDGFMKGKGHLDFAPSITYENFGLYYQELNNTLPVDRQSIAASLYTAIGVTDWLDFQITVPYIYVQTRDNLSGYQDLSSYLKFHLYQLNLEEGNRLNFMATAGLKFPLSDYETETVNAIGQADTAIDLRMVVQWTRPDGFFIMTQGGYTDRAGIVPSSYPFAIKVGWAREKRYIDIWYDQQWAVGGFNYKDWREQTPPRTLSFRSFGVSYGKLGATYYKPFGKGSGVSFSASYVLWGRNIGQALAVSAAFVQRFNVYGK